MGNIVTPEVILSILAIFLAIVNWRKGVSFEKVKTQAENERVKRQEAEARIEQIKADTEIRIQKAKDETEERTFQREQLKRQLEINEGFQKSLQDKEDRDEKNYRHLANTQRDDTNMLLNEAQSERREILQAISAIQIPQPQFSADLFNTLATELAQKISSQIAIQSLSSELFPFPDFTDPRWEEATIQPTKEDAWLRKGPYFDDMARCAHPYGMLKPGPHKVKLIRGALAGWYIIQKLQNGDPPAYGWLPDYLAKIVEPMPA